MHPVLPHLCKESPTGEKIYYTWFQAMHTRVDFLFVTDGAESFLNALSEKAFREITRIEKSANAFDPQSELSHINAHAATAPVALSPMLYEILQTALDYNRLTFGLFDVTAGSEAFDGKSIDCVKLDKDLQIRFTRPGIKINLSGFLKGYALDKIRQLLGETPISNALINMGNSSVMGLGNRGSGLPWKIPCGSNGSREITLHDECLTTSGNDTAERKHIVNPLDGNCISGKRSTSVVTRSGTLGEVLSTAFFIADGQMRQQLKKKFDIRCVIDSV